MNQRTTAIFRAVYIVLFFLTYPCLLSAENIKASKEPVASRKTDSNVVSPYMVAVRMKILDHWHAPMEGEKGKVKVSFTVYPNGSIAKLKVQTSSGYPKLDKFAIEAVEKAVPLPPFPDGLKETSLSTTFAFSN